MSNMSQQHNGVLSQEQVRLYQENGYLHMKNVMDSWELERLNAETSKMIDYCKQVMPPNDDYFYAYGSCDGQYGLAAC